jgi:hypothetical protein
MTATKASQYQVKLEDGEYLVIDPDGDTYDVFPDQAEAIEEAARKNREMTIEAIRDQVTDLLNEMTDQADELGKLMRIKAMLAGE